MFYRQARLARIYDGPDEVHKMTVARRLLAQYAGASRAVEANAQRRTHTETRARETT